MISILIAISGPLPLFFTGTQAAVLSIDEFGIVTSVGDVLDKARENRAQVDIVTDGENAILNVTSSIHASGPDDLYARSNDLNIPGQFLDSTPKLPSHPLPYELLNDPAQRPAGLPDSIFSTLTSINDLIILVDYHGGAVHHQAYDNAGFFNLDFSDLSAFDPTSSRIDLDNDGNDDVRVSLGLSIVDQTFGFNLLDLSAWMKADVRLTVDLIDENDPIWTNMDTLGVSVMKGLSYADQTYIWVIDNGFTLPPMNHALTVGLEKIELDIEPTAVIGNLLPGEVPTDYSLSGIRAPYEISIESSNVQCPDPSVWGDKDPRSESSEDRPCGISAGLGYVRYQTNSLDVADMSYIDATFHPAEGENELSPLYNLTIRNDDWDFSNGEEGQKSWDTIEYYATVPSDARVRYHENRSGVQSEDDPEVWGDITEAEAWLIDLPGTSLDQTEILNTFRQIGADPRGPTPLPGEMPKDAGLIIAIKNWSADNRQHGSTPDLPVDISDPPKAMIFIISDEPIGGLNYTSWFLREGALTDHWRGKAAIEGLPKDLMITGNFNVGGGEDDATFNFEELQSLNVAQAIIDSAIIAIVDIVLLLGNVLNGIPSIVLDLSTDGEPGTITLECLDSLSSQAVPAEIRSFFVALGSSEQFIPNGPHFALDHDRGLDALMQTLDRSPLVPIGASVSIERFSKASDETTADGGRITNIEFTEPQPFRVVHVDHDGATLNGSTQQQLTFSALPRQIEFQQTSSSLSIEFSEDIDELEYICVNGDQHDVLLIEDLPSRFDVELGNTTRFVPSEPIGAISALVTNTTQPNTMNGDHVFLERSEDGEEVTLSARISGLDGIMITERNETTSLGTGNRTVAELNLSEERTFNAAVIDRYRTDLDIHAGLELYATVRPLPQNLVLTQPIEPDGDALIEAPDFTSGGGLEGITGGLLDIANLGRALNDVLISIADTTTMSSTPNEKFGVDVAIDATTSFDVISSLQMGTGVETSPEWVHGASVRTVDDIENGGMGSIEAKIFLPSLPPESRVQVEYDNTSGDPEWSVNVELKGWQPAYEFFTVDVQGINEADIELNVQGLDPDIMGDVDIGLIFSQDLSRTVPIFNVEISADLPSDIDSIHAQLLDRQAGQRFEAVIDQVPSRAKLTASIGTSIVVDLDIPVEARPANGVAVNSLYLQIHRFAVDRWWPATVVMRDVPAELSLSTEPSREFDITESLAFQGIPRLDYIACASQTAPCEAEQLDLYISATGRALDQRGDLLFIAEDLAAYTKITPTEDWGLSLITTGDGLGRIYIRTLDLPITPGVMVDSVEVAAENIRTATIHVHEVGGLYPITVVQNVDGGRIVMTADTNVSYGKASIQGEAVAVDAQFAGLLPIGSTFGLNGFASDLAVVGELSGGRVTSTHVIFVDPFASAFASIAATIM